MNVLDLFSGAAGGWSLGMHRAGFTTVAACEADPWRRGVYGFNNPGARLYDDVRTLTAERLRVDGVGPIHVVCGSPPCQDASTANTKGRGIDGERTGLYLEAVRIVREVRPRWCAFENVPGIRNRGIDRVLSELEQAGYACWPLVVGAHDLGAPHIRQRSWVIGTDAETVQRLALPWNQPDRNSERASADAHGQRVREQQLPGRSEPEAAEPAERFAPDRASDGRGSRWSRGPGASAPWQQVELDARATPDAIEAEQRSLGEARQGDRQDRDAQRRESPNGLESAIAERVGSIAETWNGGIAGRLRMDDGLPKGMAQPLLAAYGDAVVPQAAEIIGRAILAAERVTCAAAE